MWYNPCMNVNLLPYAGKTICVACSGGRDSVALLHYLICHASEHGITLCALNCDHGIRGEESAKDSAFVADYCSSHGVPLLTFKAQGFSGEAEARSWRHECYLKAARHFGAVIATAHHLNDNAETVLFNLARGSALSGMCGITEGVVTVPSHGGEAQITLIRPLISCTRAEIDEYVAANTLPYVEDSTNSSNEYTRNYIRHDVLPRLERAVPGAAGAIFRFSRLAARDEEYLNRQAVRLVSRKPNVTFIADCREPALFSRAAVMAVRGEGKADYTSSHADALFALQNAKPGKRFCFLGLTAWKEEGRIAVCRDVAPPEPMPFSFGNFEYGGIPVAISRAPFSGVKSLCFDTARLPAESVIRTRLPGDKFTKFGGGTTALGDYFTDKKIPPRLRDRLPVIACGSVVYVICGIEISDKVKITSDTSAAGYVACEFI